MQAAWRSVWEPNFVARTPARRMYWATRVLMHPAATGRGGALTVRNTASWRDAGRRRRYAFRPERATGPKELRAEAWSGIAEAGKIRLVKAPWNAAFLDEVECFPDGEHDDQVDAVGIALAAAARGGSSWIAPLDERRYSLTDDDLEDQADDERNERERSHGRKWGPLAERLDGFHVGGRGDAARWTPVE